MCYEFTADLLSYPCQKNYPHYVLQLQTTTEERSETNWGLAKNHSTRF